MKALILALFPGLTCAAGLTHLHAPKNSTPGLFSNDSLCHVQSLDPTML
jgi:hypothetical protein